MKSRSFRRMIFKRSVNVFITIFGIITLNFLLIQAMPGDPILNMVPRDPKLDPAVKWALVEKFNLNDTLFERFITYLKNTFTLEWGISYMSSTREVVDIMADDLRWTILLIGTSTFFTFVIGIAVGAYAAYRRGGAFDLASTGMGLFFYGMPIFWFAIILQLLFNSYPLGMDWWPQLPSGDYYDTVTYGTQLRWDTGLILSILEHLILPALTLSIGSFAGVALVMRSSLIDVMTDD